MAVDEPNNGPDDSTNQTTDGTGTNDGTGTPDTGNNGDNGQTTVPVDTSQAEDDDVEQQALLLFFVIVVLLLVGLFLVSRGGEDALAAEVQIEKMWDEQEAAAEAATVDDAPSSTGFVPALPPLELPSDETE